MLISKRKAQKVTKPKSWQENIKKSKKKDIKKSMVGETYRK